MYRAAGPVSHQKIPYFSLTSFDLGRLFDVPGLSMMEKLAICKYAIFQCVLKMISVIQCFACVFCLIRVCVYMDLWAVL